jgi:hypothetical protein
MSFLSVPKYFKDWLSNKRLQLSPLVPIARGRFWSRTQKQLFVTPSESHEVSRTGLAQFSYIMRSHGFCKSPHLLRNNLTPTSISILRYYLQDGSGNTTHQGRQSEIYYEVYN